MGSLGARARSSSIGCRTKFRTTGSGRQVPDEHSGEGLQELVQQGKNNKVPVHVSEQIVKEDLFRLVGAALIFFSRMP